MSNISILSKQIRINDGLYSLNDLHKVSGYAQKHRPKYFLNNQQTKELISEIEVGGITPTKIQRGIGTFACKQLAIAYGAWISPKLHLAVIDAFLESKSNSKNTNPRERFLSEDQRGHIYQTVMSICKNKSEFAYRTYFGKLKNQFQVSTYKDILKTDYIPACHFLGVKPRRDLIEQTQMTRVSEMQQGNIVDLFADKKILLSGNKFQQLDGDHILVDMKRFGKQYRKLKTALIDMEVFMDIAGFSDAK